MERFYKGEKVFIKPVKTVDKRWQGKSVEVTNIHPGFTPTMFSCIHWPTRITLLFYETELETVFHHDKRVGIIP